jgi:hypothetical protein
VSVGGRGSRGGRRRSRGPGRGRGRGRGTGAEEEEDRPKPQRKSTSGRVRKRAAAPSSPEQDDEDDYGQGRSVAIAGGAAQELNQHRTNSLRALRAAQATLESRQLVARGRGRGGESEDGSEEEDGMWGDEVEPTPDRKRARLASSSAATRGVPSSSSPLLELSEDKKKVSPPR